MTGPVGATLSLDQVGQVADLPALPVGREPTLHDAALFAIPMSRRKFPQATIAGTIKHLRKELDEFEHAVDYGDSTAVLKELADIEVLTFQLARLLDFSAHDLGVATWVKAQVVAVREYNAPDADGVIEHVRTDAERDAKLAEVARRMA